MAAISISGLTKRYTEDGQAALSSLDLDVGDGEMLVLVGPSGCGKSTALRLVAGLEEPTGGRIELGGKDLTGVAPQHRDVAMVFQGYALYPHLSVADNMAFPLKMRGMGRTERADRVGEIAAMVGLSGKLERLPSELSGGERQRVAMGRAIVRQPKVFLFDEPLSNLDAKLRAELRVELVSLVRRLGTTSIYVTHDQAEAMTMGDRVAILNQGELQQIDAPKTVYTEPSNVFVAGFLGTPMMNLLTVDCDDGYAYAKGVRLPLPKWLSKRERVTVGFRPEHVELSSGGTIEATVDAVEPLGAQTFVYLDAGGDELRVRLDGFGGPRPGDRVALTVADERLLWFDAQDGARLSEEHSGGEA